MNKAVIHLRGPDGRMRLMADAERAERRARLQALVNLPDWALVADGLRAQRQRTMEAVAMGSHLTEQEVREGQARYRLLTDLLATPVEWLLQFGDEGE